MAGLQDDRMHSVLFDEAQAFFFGSLSSTGASGQGDAQTQQAASDVTGRQSRQDSVLGGLSEPADPARTESPVASVVIKSQ